MCGTQTSCDGVKWTLVGRASRAGDMPRVQSAPVTDDDSDVKTSGGLGLNRCRRAINMARFGAIKLSYRASNLSVIDVAAKTRPVGSIGAPCQSSDLKLT
jgi:hypothetical protein